MKITVRISLVIFIGFLCLNTMAQVGNIIVFAPKGEKFTLFIGSTMHNNEPAARVEADNPGGPSFKLRIVFPDPSIKEITKLTFNKPHSTMYYMVTKNPKGVYVLESTTSEWMEEKSGSVKEDAPPPPAPETSAGKKGNKSEQTSQNEPAKSTKSKGCDNPISDPDFTARLIDVSARPFEPLQLSAAKQMAETHCLRVSQVILVINIFDSESSRISFAKFAYDHTYDQENYADVKDALHSQSSKNDLDRYIAGKTK